jgi:hypothetical protein
MTGQRAQRYVPDARRAGSMGRMRSVLALAAVALLLVAAPASAASKSCGSIANPYPGTRYEGEPLSNIRATGVSCTTARSVAKNGHKKALGGPLPADGIRRATWNGWKIRGDLRGAHDAYTATKNGHRVTWRF